MRSRTRNGSIVQDKRDKVWRFYWWEDGKRLSKMLGKFASKTAAIQAADALRDELRKSRPAQSVVPSVAELITRIPSGEDAQTL